MRALIIEDDQTIADFVARGLREAGFAVDVAADGDAGLELASSEPYDAAIVDLMLPKRDGLSVIDELRRRGRSTPVLILSARRSVDDRVRGLQAGGDDYLTKPFAFAELLARVQALIRRSTGAAGARQAPLRPGDGRGRADTPGRRGSHAGPADTQGAAGIDRARPSPARVLAARIPDAQCGQGSLEDHDPVACVGLYLRSKYERRGRAGLAAARQDRSSVPEEAAADRARRRLRLKGVMVRGRLGLRLSLWYAVVFVVSMVVLVGITYWLLASSLARRDHDIIAATLREYALRYESDGLPALERAVEVE